MAWTGVITNAGNRLLTQWEGGGVLHIESAAAGTGTAAEVALLAQTDLVSRKQSASILSKEDVPEGLKIRLQITAPDTGYTLNQYGIWARLDEGPSTLLALFQRPDGIPIPSKAESPDFVYTFYGLLAISNQGKLELHIDTSALVRWKDLRSVEAQLRGLIDAAVGSVTTVSLTIPTAGWQEINHPTAGEGGSPYPFYIDVPCQEASASSSPDVTLEPGALAVARNAGLCSVAEALDGSIRFWAQTIPSEAMEATVKLFGSSGAGGGGGGGAYTLPVAGPDTLGGIKSSDSLRVDEDGTAHAQAEISEDNFATNEEVKEALDAIFGAGE